MPKAGSRPSTRALYERNMRQIVLPAFEGYMLREITVSKVDRFIKAPGNGAELQHRQAGPDRDEGCQRSQVQVPPPLQSFRLGIHGFLPQPARDAYPRRADSAAAAWRTSTLRVSGFSKAG
mgnify:CR=1 FL=1